MGYSLFGRFVDVKNKKVLCAAELGFLKNLNEYRYSKDMGGITPSGIAKDEDYPEVTTYTSIEFHNYYKKALLEDAAVKDSIKPYANKRYSYGVEFPRYIIERSILERNAEVFDKYAIHNITRNHDGEDENGATQEVDAIMLFTSEVKKEDGDWYTAEDFKEAGNTTNKEYEEARVRLDKLKALRDSKDWFEMSENAQNSLLNEIGYAEETFEDADWKKYAIDTILSYFNFWQEHWYYRDENGEYTSRYDDNRKVELYLTVD